jgi:hypothetical protein
MLDRVYMVMANLASGWLWGKHTVTDLQTILIFIAFRTKA